jgi:hypothetical protein
MKLTEYEVSKEAPLHVRNWLKHTKSRKHLVWVVVLSPMTALMIAYAERGKPGALLGLVFLFIAIPPYLALRWGDRHHYFDRK